MKYSNNTITNIKDNIESGRISSQQLFEEAVNKAKHYQEDYNSFVTILDSKQEEKEGILKGVVYSLKDNISTKGILTTASSNILKNYVPVYDATVYKKLKEAGAVLIGKNVLDELAMGGTGTTGHTGIVKNPWNKERQIGGSSAGSAAAVALDIVPFSIGSDTGDSIRKPAAYAGVVGFKPTYGRISRYGLFAFASSLDHLGVITRNVYDAALVTDVCKGHDVKDMTSLEDDNISYSKKLDKEITNKKLFYIKEICELDSKDNTELNEILKTFENTITKCRELGMQVEAVSIDKQLLSAIYPTYKTISCAEVTSNNANLCGIQFGVRGEGNNVNDIIMDARTKGFSELIKRRFVMGSYVLQRENQEKLFLNACRIRRLIVDKINNLFKEYDAMILPAGGIAPSFDKEADMLSEEYLLLENHLAIGNFGGFPSITIPNGIVNEMPVGVNITGPAKEDLKVLNIAFKLEEKLGYKNMIARGVDLDV